MDFGDRGMVYLSDAVCKLYRFMYDKESFHGAQALEQLASGRLVGRCVLGVHAAAGAARRGHLQVRLRLRSFGILRSRGLSEDRQVDGGGSPPECVLRGGPSPC